MRINCKLLMTSVIVCCTATSVFARKDDTLIIKSDDNVSLQQQSTFDRLKNNVSEIFNKDISNTQKSGIEDVGNCNTISQFYNRFDEKTYIDNITEIDGQSVDSIKEEIKKLDDSKLTKENLETFSRGLVKFIATGVLSYGNNDNDKITPEDALNHYNSIVDAKSKLSEEEFKKAQKEDLDQINMREALQDFAKEINEIKAREKSGINASQGEYLQIIETSEINDELKKMLQSMLSNNYNDTSLAPIEADKEQIKELQKIVNERLKLPGEKEDFKTKLKKLGNSIKTRLTNFFKRNKNNKQDNNETNNTTEESKQNFNPITQKQVKIRTIDDDDPHNKTLTKDQAVELMIENSPLIGV